MYCLSFKLSKCSKNLICFFTITQLLQSPLIHASCFFHLSILHLELGVAYPRINLRVPLYKSFEYPSSSLNFLISDLKLDERHPSLLIGHPIHPPLENLPRASHIPKHLLHVNVFVPQLIDSRQKSNRPIPNVPRTVDEPVLHLCLGVLEPERVILPIVGEFIDVDYLPFRPAYFSRLLKLASLAKNMFGCDLYWSWCFVLDRNRSRKHRLRVSASRVHGENKYRSCL
ncbi:hypothetical protein G2W53_034645 [Senna tora]|uniref:Uncharacterized protein n=1 Tax=Senna tora TaxID=362788 RepID=A0A834T0N0_9FABA|nr:hypothetical protein G2W53_034645 [Senna tora]